MPYPNQPNKQSALSLTTPKQHLEYKFAQGLEPVLPRPKTVIMTFQRSFMAEVRERHPMQPVGGYFRELWAFEDQPDLAIGLYGVGAPASTIKTELMAAWGVSRFIVIGHAGSLQKDVQPADIVLCDRAIRDEGTSQHYLPHAKFAFPTHAWTENIEAQLRQDGVPHHRGATWTTDALFRHTVQEVTQYQQEGVLTVEMEASALFVLAECLEIEVAALFAISDSLADKHWSEHFQAKSTSEAMHKILETVRNCVKTTS